MGCPNMNNSNSGSSVARWIPGMLLLLVGATSSRSSRETDTRTQSLGLSADFPGRYTGTAFPIQGNGGYFDLVSGRAMNANRGVGVQRSSGRFFQPSLASNRQPFQNQGHRSENRDSFARGNTQLQSQTSRRSMGNHQRDDSENMINRHAASKDVSGASTGTGATKDKAPDQRIPVLNSANQAFQKFASSNPYNADPDRAFSAQVSFSRRLFPGRSSTVVTGPDSPPSRLPAAAFEVTTEYAETSTAITPPATVMQETTLSTGTAETTVGCATVVSVPKKTMAYILNTGIFELKPGACFALTN